MAYRTPASFVGALVLTLTSVKAFVIPPATNLEQIVQFHIADKPQPAASSEALFLSVALWMDDEIATESKASSDNYPMNFDSFKKDRVVRVLDSNTVQLEKAGKVKLAGVQTPSASSANFKFPDCFRYDPDYKIKQLLPPKAKVLVKLYDRQAIVVTVDKNAKERVVNIVLLETGFARVRKPNLSSDVLPSSLLERLQNAAVLEGRGIFTDCSTKLSEQIEEATFEPIIRTETQWRIDGGRPVRRVPESISSEPPSNPGDRVGCSDFAYYEDAMSYFERYLPYFGDVARLDRDKDGIPCPRLPHTPNADRYRMKKPTTIAPLSQSTE